MAIMRTTIHLDLDAFFCVVEEQRDPTLRGKAFAVGGRPESRGVVASAWYMARKFGVHSAMPMAQAARLRPDLIVVSPNFAAYRAASQQVIERLHAFTSLVEQISIDEAFLDVTTLGDSGNALAVQLQATIRAAVTRCLDRAPHGRHRRCVQPRRRTRHGSMWDSRRPSQG
jgi:DNA polymerase-4